MIYVFNYLEHDYFLKDYFNANERTKLIGKLLVERMLGESSEYYHYINSLPQPDLINDYHHFSIEEK